jgi:hypothetical protein
MLLGASRCIDFHSDAGLEAKWLQQRVRVWHKQVGQAVVTLCF